MASPRYMLERSVPANYQNGNTKRASTLNVYRWKQLAMSNGLNELIDYAKSLSLGVGEMRITANSVVVVKINPGIDGEWRMDYRDLYYDSKQKPEGGCGNV